MKFNFKMHDGTDRLIWKRWLHWCAFVITGCWRVWGEFEVVHTPSLFQPCPLQHPLRQPVRAAPPLCLRTIRTALERRYSITDVLFSFCSHDDAWIARDKRNKKCKHEHRCLQHGSMQVHVNMTAAWMHEQRLALSNNKRPVRPVFLTVSNRGKIH